MPSGLKAFSFPYKCDTIDKSDWTPRSVATAVFHVFKQNGPLTLFCAYPYLSLASFVEEEKTPVMAAMKRIPETPENTLSETLEEDTGRVNGNGRAKPAGAATSEYSGEQIEILEGLEPVRVRPGMYIGSTDVRGLHQLVQEVVDNSVDEAMAGVANRAVIVLQQ